MKNRCQYCHTYRIEDEEGRRLENEDEFAEVCFDCEEWLEGDEEELT